MLCDWHELEVYDSNKWMCSCASSQHRPGLGEGNYDRKPMKYASIDAEIAENTWECVEIKIISIGEIVIGIINSFGNYSFITGGESVVLVCFWQNMSGEKSHSNAGETTSKWAEARFQISLFRLLGLPWPHSALTPRFSVGWATNKKNVSVDCTNNYKLPGLNWLNYEVP